jgi:hypothetical protein
MDDWGFGIWVVPIALSAALCFAVADQFPSGRSVLTRVFHYFWLVFGWLGLAATLVLMTTHLVRVL